MRLYPSILAIACMLWGIASCTSTKTINETYAAELAQLEPGTSLEQFRMLLPEAAPAGQNLVEGERVDAYELRHKYKYDQVLAAEYTEQQRLWFYFHNGTLVKWGPPGAWPESADLIIEHRDR